MLTLVRRDPGKGYIGRQLWLPKSQVNIRSVKAGLEFPIMEDTGFTFLQLWEETTDHIIVPRQFFSNKEINTLPFQVISVQPMGYPTTVIESRIELDGRDLSKTTQRDAFASMLEARGGILNLGCGKGKTILALHYVSQWDHPVLVVVNNTTLINQWRDRIEEFLDVKDGVGVIQGPPEEWDWEGRGIVLAMIHSLALHAPAMPEKMDRYFGTIIYDEVHHLSAPLFSQTAPLFYGERQGLTATVGREDGLEPIYQYHIGQVYHRDLMQDLRPRVYFQQCPVHVDWKRRDVQEQIYDKRGKVNIPKLRSYLGTLPECNDFIVEKLSTPLAAGRKILALSHSVDQLRALHGMFDDAGLCTGREKPEARLESLRSKQLTFGTLQLVKEALDEPTLDTLFFLTPFGSNSVEDGGFNTLQQGMGRILRVKEGKKTPVVVIFDHMYIPVFHKMCLKLRRQLKAWPTDQGGPLDYKIVRPYTGEVQ